MGIPYVCRFQIFAMQSEKYRSMALLSIHLIPEFDYLVLLGIKNIWLQVSQVQKSIILLFCTIHVQFEVWF